MKANIYIDGGNLYFGLLKGRPEVKWLDLDAFCRRLAGVDHELNAIKYFTANIKTYPHDPASVERQNLYLQAVEAKGWIETIFGYYNKNKTWLPARRSDLIHHVTIYRDIPRDLPTICQLPDEVPVGKNGKTIRRPAAWK